MKLSLAFIIITISSLISYTQPTLEWARRYNGPANDQDAPSAIVVDRLGNVYVTGTSRGANLYDYCTIKYNGSGDSLWVRRWDSTMYDGGADIALDSSGNVYVTGYPVTIKYDSGGNRIWVNSGVGVRIVMDGLNSFYLSGSPNSRYQTDKYNLNGGFIWRSVYNGGGNLGDRVRDIAMDGFGNIIVTGQSYRTQTHWDYCTVKYNSNGDSVWVKRYNGPGSPPQPPTDYAYAVATDYSGNVFVTGWSRDVDDNYKMLTIKYSGAGDSLWVRRYTNYPNSSGHDIETDGAGNVYVLGVAGAGYYIILKFGTNGNIIASSLPIWGHSFASAGINRIVLDSSKNIYLAGIRYVNTYRSDILVTKLDSSLNTIWEFQYHVGTPTGDVNSPNDIALDDAGNVYVTGGGPSITGGGGDYITLKISQTTGVINISGGIPENYKLHRNYPNPFNPSTKIIFDLVGKSFITLTIFDSNGREVESLVNKSLEVGRYYVIWNARNFASGIYFCVLRAEGFSESVKLVLIK